MINFNFSVVSSAVLVSVHFCLVFSSRLDAGFVFVVLGFVEIREGLDVLRVIGLQHQFFFGLGTASMLLFFFFTAIILAREICIACHFNLREIIFCEFKALNLCRVT